MRQHETQGPGKMGRLGQQHLAFLQRLADQAEFVGFQVAQAAMDQLGRLGGGGAGEIVHFAEADLERPPRRVAGDACAIDAAADHEQVERPILRSIHGLPIARLTGLRRNRKRPHGFPAQDRAVRPCHLRRVQEFPVLEGSVRPFYGQYRPASASSAAPIPASETSDPARAADRGTAAQACGHRGYCPVRRLRCLYFDRCGKMRPMRPSKAIRPQCAASLDRLGGGTYFAAPQKRP